MKDRTPRPNGKGEGGPLRGRIQELPVPKEEEQQKKMDLGLPKHPSHKTVSGASGEALRRELQKALAQQKKEDEKMKKMAKSTSAGNLVGLSRLDSTPLLAIEKYDKTVQPFVNAGYDFLQLSSGRDKVLSFLQNVAKIAADSFCESDDPSYGVYRSVESSLSDGRKVFRFFKWWREVYKIRRGIYRYQSGRDANGSNWCIDAICGIMDTFGHVFSFFYFLLDNLLWAVSIGLLQSKETPKMVASVQDLPRNGVVVASFGGIRNMKTFKDAASYFRTIVAFAANVMLFVKASNAKLALQKKLENPKEIEKSDSSSDVSSDSDTDSNSSWANWKHVTPYELANLFWIDDPDDPVLFHLLELLGIYSNMTVLRVKLGLTSFRLSNTQMGIFGCIAALTSIWRNWRKVIRKKCGAKSFKLILPSME